jgi:glycosyltransferase involved in cell wall biosynthesis
MAKNNIQQQIHSLVSIIIPSFNRADLIPETLESIISQTYKNWECIVVDDGSTDQTVKILEEYASKDIRFKIYSRPSDRPKGANTCRNFGFELAKGEYIQWFDSDDIMNPNMLERKVNELSTSKIDFVVCAAKSFDHVTKEIQTDTRENIKPKTKNPALEFFAGGFWFGTPQALFLKSYLISQKKLFSATLRRHQETEFFVRLLLNNPKVFYIEEPLLNIRIHSSSIGGLYNNYDLSKKLLIDWEAYRLIYTNFKDSIYLDSESRIYFIDFFYRCLRKMEYKFIKHTQLLVFGLKNNLFPSRYIAIKYYITRTIHYLVGRE